MKLSKIVFPFLFLLFLAACQSDSKPKKNKIISPPRLVFETIIDSLEMPRSSIFLSFDESKIKIDAAGGLVLAITFIYWKRRTIIPSTKEV